jgi:hypothetical protein
VDTDSLLPAIHEVAVYTDELEVKGEMKAWPPRRVLDGLNSGQIPFLTIERASVIPLTHWGKSRPSVVDAITLNKQEIIFVWPIREAAVEVSEFKTVHKVPHDMIAYAGPFIFQGTLHRISEARRFRRRNQPLRPLPHHSGVNPQARSRSSPE